MAETGRAVGGVQDDRLMTKAPNEALRAGEPGDLLCHVLRVGIGRRKVSHEAHYANRGEAPKLAKKLGQLTERDAKTTHPGVDLEMNVDGTVGGDRFEGARLGEIIKDGCQPRGDDVAVSATADPIEDEYRAVDSGIAKLDAFLGKRHPEAIDPFSLQSLRDRNHTVPVRIGLHDREDFAPFHGAPHHVQVVSDRIEQHLGARRPQGGVRTLHARPQWPGGIGLHGLELTAGTAAVKHWRPHAVFSRVVTTPRASRSFVHFWYGRSGVARVGYMSSTIRRAISAPWSSCRK